MDYLKLLEYAISNSASDIHLVPGAVPVIRKNGRLMNVTEIAPLDFEEILAVVNSICTESQADRLKNNGEVSFSYSIHDLGRFRVNILMQRGTYSIAFRILQLVIPTTLQLGLPVGFVDLLDAHRGLLLVSGASGSGKSTTIAALINLLNENHKLNIITVEEPIEYLFKHKNSIVLQRDVGTDCTSIYEGVLSAMRHDPDVLIISELSDERVIDLALQVAESGKMVICGISSNNSRSAIEKVISTSTPEKMENRKYKLTSTLQGILSQQLIPDLNDENQLLAYEFLMPNAAIKSYILNDQLKDIVHALIAGKKNGMAYMDNILFELYKSGKIKRATVYKYAHDLEYVKRLEITNKKV